MFLAALLNAHSARIQEEGVDVNQERVPEPELKNQTSELNDGDRVGTDIGGLA